MSQSFDQHPSRFQLERWILESRADAELMGHVNACAACHAVAEDIRAQNNAFLVRHPFSSFEANLEARLKPARGPALFRRAWLLKAVPVGAMAVLALFIARIYDPAPEVRYKGHVALGYYLQAGDQAVKGPKSGPVRAGDVIRLYAQSQRNPHVLVIGLEESGKMNFYYPDPPGMSVAIPTGEPYLFPDSIQLDDSPQGELFVAVFSRDPLDAAAIGETLRQKSEELKREGKTLKDWKPSLLKQDNDYFYLEKAGN